MSRIALAAFVLVTLALAACTSDKKEPEPVPNILPTNYKQEVIDALTPVLDDPTNIREAAISDPELQTAGHDQRYTLCVRFNPRDLARRYRGIQYRIGYFFAGHLNQLVEATPEQCGRAAYKPFPELEKLCLAKECR